MQKGIVKKTRFGPMSALEDLLYELLTLSSGNFEKVLSACDNSNLI